LIPRGTFPPAEFLAAVLVGLVVRGTYGPGDSRRDGTRILAGTALGLGLIFWKRVWQGVDSYGLVGFLIAAFVIGCAIVVERAMVDRLVTAFRPKSGNAPRTLIVGATEDIGAARRHPALSDPNEFAIISEFDAEAITLGDPPDFTDRLVAVIERDAIDTVVICGHLQESTLQQMLEVVDAAGCHVFSLPRTMEFSGLVPRLVWRRGAPLVQLTRPGLRGQHLFAKRLLDVSGAVVGLALLSPVYVAVAVAIRCWSPGPILFRQRRVGRGGRCFSILKFRSMVIDAEAQRPGLGTESVYHDERLFKVRHDPRVTRLGTFLRRTSLDELPQLWNVLRGEMSLVGPRPPLPSEVRLYEAHHYGRFHMKPGITGPWQVNGRNRITDFEAVVRLEAAYMWQWSLWRDLAILLRTVPAVLRMDGAH
jgi:exopolysaccharide biosynthesis polyprenyl glycosylphosphotransferase